MKVIVNDCMSSEESGDDEDTYVVHPLPWRSPYVNTMFAKIDAYSDSKKSPQGRRQMKGRKPGTPSTRPCPTDLPEWAIKSQATK